MDTHNINTPNEKLASRILDQLAGGKEEDDIIFELCENNGVTWADAKALVDHVREENHHVITRRQSPLLAIIALLTYIGGLLILGYEVYLFVSYMRDINPSPEIISLLNAPGIASFFAEYAILFLELTPLALAMILGSLIGMRDIWAALLFSEKD